MDYVCARLIEGEDNLHQIATQYFNEFFEAKPMEDNSSLILKIEPCITTQHNEELVWNFKTEEVVEALKDMTPLKAVGTDGFQLFSFKNTGI